MLYHKAKLLFACAVISTCLGGVASAQDGLVKKPYSQWSKSDAEKILNDSPWATAQEVRIKFAGEVRTVAGGPNPAGAQGGLLRTEENTASLGGAQAPIDFIFTLRLRSALPVRQALVRLKQLEANYDKMGEKEKAAFDAKNKGTLDCPACAGNYVVTLSAKSKEAPGADPVFSSFKGARIDDLKRYVFIADERGARRALVHFVAPKAPGDEAVFFFPRVDDKGAPLLTPASKMLIFNVTESSVNNVTNFRLDVSRLILNGVVEF